MSRLTQELGPFGLEKIFQLAITQREHFDVRALWNDSYAIMERNGSQWHKVEFYMSHDILSPSVYLVALHRHLGLSRKTSPYAIVTELKAYFEAKLNRPGLFGFAEWGKFTGGERINSTNFKTNLLE